MPRRTSSSCGAQGPSWDASRRLEEQAGWTEHAAFMDGLVDSGFVALGGRLADEHRVTLVVEAASEDELRETHRQRSVGRDASSDRSERPLDDPAG